MGKTIYTFIIPMQVRIRSIIIIRLRKPIPLHAHHKIAHQLQALHFNLNLFPVLKHLQALFNSAMSMIGKMSSVLQGLQISSYLQEMEMDIH
jgi:hypothetical protein